MAGYVRQSSAEIATGQVVLAAPVNAEFNALQSAFNATTGHTHDGSTANGPKISLTASVSGTLPLSSGGTGATTAAAAWTNISGLGVTVDNTLPRFDGVAGLLQTSGVVVSDTNAVSGIVGLTVTGGGSLTGTWTSLGTVTTIDINGGTIDGTVIGGASRTTANFTDIVVDSQIFGHPDKTTSYISMPAANPTAAKFRFFLDSVALLDISSADGIVMSTDTDITGTLEVSSTITGSSVISDANFSRTTAGTINIRPSGNASTTGQATLTTAGTFSTVVLGATTAVRSANGSAATPSFSFTGDTNTGFFWATTDRVGVSIAGTERARWATDGLHVGRTLIDTATSGVSVNTDGRVSATVATGIAYCFLGNRDNDDGTLVQLRQANATEGSISVSGATVSYNAFMGSHWSQLIDQTKPVILRGTVCESIDELCVWPDEGNDRLPKFKISDTPGSKAVYGVFFAWDNEDNHNDAYIAGLGAGWVRIAPGVAVTRGDYLESNGDGCARVQSDDVFRASTIAKVSSATVIETYPDGSYLVPCTLHCG